MKAKLYKYETAETREIDTQFLTIPTDCKYGYKICYRELGKSKLKLFLVTNSFDLAVWHIRWYEREPPPKIVNPVWVIQEVKSLKEYERLWKGCPFKDDLS